MNVWLAGRWYVTQALKHAVAIVPRPFREPWAWGMVSAVERAERLSPEELERLQLARLNHILAWATRNVPFYRRTDLSRTLPLTSLEDLRRWPTVDRATIASAPHLFVAEGFPGWRTRVGATTGRSGRPLAVRWEWPKAVWWERAFHERLFRWAGLEHGFRRVVLRGGLVHGPGGPESRFWQVVPHERALVLSVHQLRPDTVAAYVRLAHRFRPHLLHAYPSAAVKLAKLVTGQRLTFPPLHAILTSSEALLPEDRALIEETFRAPVLDFYGHAERAVAAAQCGQRRGYHVFEDYGLAELLDERGEAADEGEIVATGFLNRAMPFIRYRTGDRAAWAPNPCPCGVPFRVFQRLDGREPDFLIGRDGSKLSLRMGLGARDLEGILELRFYQSRPGEAEVHYVGSPDAQPRLARALEQRTAGEVRYRFRRVDRLPPTPGDKGVLVVHHP